MSQLARNWWIPADGIDRSVISADIQRYLGNDATVRPGTGNAPGEEGIDGYWIRAYRNLTTAMISDLKADSQRWRQEQRSTGTRESYVGSQAYHHNNSTRPAPRRDADSPKLDGSYVAPPSRDRMPPSVINGVQPGLPRHASERGYQPERERERERYEPTRGYPPERNYPSERYDRDTAMTGMPTGYNRQPVTSAYGQDPVYASQYPPQPSNDGAPPGYIRQGEYYIPDPGYGRGQPPSRSEAPQYGQSQYGQLPRGPEVRDPRDARDPREMRDPRDPRYGQPAGYGQPDYQDPRDPRYAYPSPAATVSSITARDREPVTGPSQPSIYGSAPQYDQYGRPIYPPGQAEPGYTPSSREPQYSRDRPSGQQPDARRRRMQ